METIRINIRKYFSIRNLGWVMIVASFGMFITAAILLYTKVVGYNTASTLPPPVAPTTVSEAKIQQIRDLQAARQKLPDLQISASRFR